MDQDNVKAKNRQAKGPPRLAAYGLAQPKEAQDQTALGVSFVGLPVLNNYPGWISELFKQYNCGITVSPDNPVAFADSLIKLEKEKYKLPEMSLNARTLAKNEFDRVHLSAKWVNGLTS